MTTRYVEPKPPRFTRETIPGGYQFIIPARKNWFVIPFLFVWLTGWTLGGVAAITQVVNGEGGFLLVWMIFWAVAWLFVLSQLTYMLVGKEFVRCTHGDISIGYKSFLLSKTWT